MHLFETLKLLVLWRNTKTDGTLCMPLYLVSIVEGDVNKGERKHMQSDVESHAKSRAKSRDLVKRGNEFLFPCKITCKITRKLKKIRDRCVEWFNIFEQ